MPNPNHDPKTGEFSSGPGGLAAGLAAGLGAEHANRNRPDFSTMKVPEIIKTVRDMHGVDLVASPAQKETAQALAVAIGDFTTKYPGSDLKKVVIGKTHVRASYGTTTELPGGGSQILISQTIQTRMKGPRAAEWQQLYDEDSRNRTNIGLVGENVAYGTFRHEFGHVLDLASGKKTRAEVPGIVSKQFVKDTGFKTKSVDKLDFARSPKFRDWEKANRPSLYGELTFSDRGSAEFVAEAFADVEANGDKARPLSKIVHKKLTGR
jgi:hypothetical protein